MIPPLHAESVKPLCVLLKAYFRKPQNQDMALEYFDQAINILEFHVGPYHPLHASTIILCNIRYLFNNVLMLPTKKKVLRLSSSLKISANLLHTNTWQ